ncbi:leucine-rich repeat-containing protein 15 [Caerostris extrusa]|uniref:Leucine-rich repeat-containing protein 15 n=1 Tax=Caerostris extrusa TaxID=172846 RepID=A0AAV4XP41_CAEEX|nr:leucine-rich repeat-containing protein 15 [Caerostris extrusa]
MNNSPMSRWDYWSDVLASSTTNERALTHGAPVMMITTFVNRSIDLRWHFYWICLVALLGVAVFGDDSCPTPEELAPCTCDGEGLNCMGARTLEEIKKAFNAKFKYGGVRSVWVQGTPLTHLPADIFGNVKSQQFYVEVNNITTIDANAFSASKKTLHTLSLFGNKIKDFPYSGLSIYENLGTLNLGRNLIETIPDNAFNNRNLYAIILAQNKISHIGMNAFSNLPNLGRLEMALNQLVTLGPMSLAFKSHSSSLQVYLSPLVI